MKLDHYQDNAPDSDPGPVNNLRQPPHSVEAEQSVLGGLMLDNSAWDKIADIVSVDDFYRHDHRLIFTAIHTLAERSQPIDVVTVSEYLEARGHLAETGGLTYLGTLAKDTPSASNIRAYANIVRERSTLRSLIMVGGEIADLAYDADGTAVHELVDKAESKVFEIAEGGKRRGSGFVPLSDVMPGALNRLDELYHSDGDITGVATGFTDFDRMTAGLQPGDLVIIAGRPSMGKTSFAMNIAEHAALAPVIHENSGAAIATAFFSMEMSAEQLSFRLISSLAHVGQGKLRTGNFAEEDWPSIHSAISWMSEAPIYIDDTPAMTPTEIRARARRLKREHGLGLIIVDYLQLMQVSGNTENRATEISEISRGLKALARELEVPVIALSQLNRSVE
ncbi:MAG: replicative DNA helicase, partial [Gammaproteobacteria bacterium]|nr:replicative DNA helicase [Gammaproteobacteria bacterium]